MSGKRKRAPQQSTYSQSNASDTYSRLCALMAPGHDHAQIDALLSQHQKSLREVSPCTSADLTCCPRAYEESYLREPVGSERPCVRGNACEGMSLLVSSPFTLREFVYPGKEQGDTKTLCLLCRREEISNAYYRLETSNVNNAKDVVLSDHYNLVGVPGEYDVRDCIVSSGKYTGVLLPVVLHIRSAYKSYESDGVRCLSQARLRYPDDVSDESRGPFLGRRAALSEKVAPSKTSPAAKSI